MTFLKRRIKRIRRTLLQTKEKREMIVMNLRMPLMALPSSSFVFLKRYYILKLKGAAEKEYIEVARNPKNIHKNRKCKATHDKKKPEAVELERRHNVRCTVSKGQYLLLTTPFKIVHPNEYIKESRPVKRGHNRQGQPPEASIIRHMGVFRKVNGPVLNGSLCNEGRSP
jgi:hypothetical protein